LGKKDDLYSCSCKHKERSERGKEGRRISVGGKNKGKGPERMGGHHGEKGAGFKESMS